MKMINLIKRQYSSDLGKSAKNIVNSLLHGEGITEGHDLHNTHSKLLAKGTTIHELLIHNVKPDCMDAYEHKEMHPTISDNSNIPQRLFGSWKTEIGSLDQGVHIWEYDSYVGYEHSHLLLAQDSSYQQYLKELKPLLRSRESQIILEFAFWNSSVPYDSSNIYELRSYMLKPGRLLEWEQGWRRGLAARKQFVEPVGAWFSQLGQLNYVHHMWVYPSLQVRKEMREESWKIKEWGESVKKTGA